VRDLDYLVQDLRTMYVRMAANEGWFRQMWLGVPIWQLAEDLIRLQRVVVDIKPRWIVETGTKYGGSAIFFASILQMLGRTPQQAGGIVTIDIHQTDEAKETLASHSLASFVKASFVGDAAAPEMIAKIKQFVDQDPGPTLVFLDDNHNADHVHREMMGYAPLVTVGSFLVVADTSFADLGGTPVGRPTDKYPDVAASNPRVAVNRFLGAGKEFERDMGYSDGGASNFLDGFLRRVEPI
jgi:cephalosporin hydroxylase